MAFLEEQFDLCASFGGSLGESYSVEISETKGGNEYRLLNHPYPKLEIEINFDNRLESTFRNDIIDLFHRSNGIFGGFRYPWSQDFSTKDYVGVPSFDDQLCVLVTTNNYQITRWYGTEGGSTAARRRIKKPRSGSVLVGIRNNSSNSYKVQLIQQWSVDITTGIITFDANAQDNIVDISQAAQAVIDFSPGSHPYSVNDTVHISEVSGMVQINGLRATIVSATATTITIDIDSTSFDAYSSGGVTNTVPQTSEEEVVAGCYYDIPVRFLTDLAGASINNRNGENLIITSGVQLIELLNP